MKNKMKGKKLEQKVLLITRINFILKTILENTSYNHETDL